MPLGDPIYEYLDRLADLGLAPSYLRSMRPVTVDAAARLVARAATLAARGGRPEPAVVTVTRELVERLRPHRWRGLDAGGQAAVAGGLRREVVDPVPASVAERAGYLEPRSGATLAAGEGAAVGLSARGAYGGFAAAEVGLSLDFPNGGAAAHLRRGAAKLGWGALELQVGRDDVAWGQARYAPMALSGFAPALDLMLVRTVRPVRLPWVFRYLGEWQVAVFAARLDQELPHRRPWLIGARLAVKPWSWLELGFVHLLSFGGEGAPSISAEGLVQELFGYRRDVYASNYANHVLSADLHVRVKRWFELYGEWYLEDCCAHPWGQDTSLVIGARRARVIGARDDLAVEVAGTSRIAGLSSGGLPEWSQGRVLTGHPLGPKGLGAYALYTLLGDRGEVLKLRLAVERRGAPYDVAGIEPQWRVGGHVDLRWPLRPGRSGRVDARLRLGLERVVSVGRVAGDDRFAGLAEVVVEASF